MANHMAQVAKMLGVELDEEFEIKEIPSKTTFRFSALHTTLYYSNDNIHWDQAPSDTLLLLLNGTYTIKRKPWKPTHDEFYWYVDPNRGIYKAIWLDRVVDKLHYKLGNCYRTEEQAEANRKKWIAFYVSDEVLEV